MIAWNRLAFEQFFAKALKIHNGKYKYDETTFTCASSKITIICSIHGEFSQIASSHLAGIGCPSCGFLKGQTSNNKKRLTKEEFVNRANIIHHNFYDYSEFIYISFHKKSNIICPIHGKFAQTPAHHLNKRKCPKCAIIEQHKLITKTTSEFIEQAKLIHKNKYTYSKVNYINQLTKLEIICPTHGSFWQIPSSHLYGANSRPSGCPKCSINISNIELLWLDHLSIPENYRQKVLIINSKKFRVDAFDPTINTVYEFYGDFWHGNPKVFDPNNVNIVNGKSYKELYSSTLKREEEIIKAGYRIISIWENDFEQILNLKAQ